MDWLQGIIVYPTIEYSPTIQHNDVKECFMTHECAHGVSLEKNNQGTQWYIQCDFNSVDNQILIYTCQTTTGTKRVNLCSIFISETGMMVGIFIVFCIFPISFFMRNTNMCSFQIIYFFKELSRDQHAAAKSLQSCPTLCDPIDGSPPGSPVPGIPQARTLEWIAISFSNPAL